MPDLEPSYGDLDAATIAVRDLIAASRELVGRMAHAMDMNPNDMSALGALTQNGPMGVAELAVHLGIRSASATAMVDRLERAGHVERVRDTVDRRRVIVTETSTARRVAYDAWFPVVDSIDQVCRELSDRDRSVVTRFLDGIAAVIGRVERADGQDARG